ncbi:UDP-3-O-(3-hydroxymyristoyl)glucosamine N-acyltransferase [Rhizobium helianthi]|uniref:UDP-3-O-acylglucosamine N-acyltransferase n=1 Tax=Rhizobium helianthi TaxID=1132695 RepID=A0ABW4M091_9HYPH
MDHHRFFPLHEGIALRDLADRVGMQLVSVEAGSKLVRSVAPVYRAQEGDICYLVSRKYRDELETCQATAIICSADIEPFVPDHVAVLRTKTPHAAFATVGGLLHPEALQPLKVTENGISPKACIHETAKLEAGVVVEPFAVIGANAEIGEGSHIGANTVIGPDVKIGRNCSVASGATIFCAYIGNNVIIHTGARIGQDGFGFAPGPAGMIKMVQVGRVIIQDNVDIGANTTIDRGAMDDTVIGEGTKIDNLVQIGHNVRIGRHTALASGVGIAGSTRVGSGVQIGGAAGINGHITIGDGAQIAGMSGVVTSVPAGARYGGFPARPLQDFLRESADIMNRAQARRKKKDAHNG